MHRGIPQLQKTWLAESRIAILLVVVIVASLLLHLGPRMEAVEETVLSGLTFLFVLLGAVKLTRSGSFRAVSAFAILLALTTVALDWYLLFHRSPLASRSHALSLVIFLGLLAFYVAKRVFDSSSVTQAKLVSAVLLYLLIAALCGNLYVLLEEFSAGSFRFTDLPQSALMLRKTLTYFSFITITTVGFGDVIPMHPLARALVALEACFGVLYPALVVARLVSLDIACSHDKR